MWLYKYQIFFLLLNVLKCFDCPQAYIVSLFLLLLIVINDKRQTFWNKLKNRFKTEKDRWVLHLTLLLVISSRKKFHIQFIWHNFNGITSLINLTRCFWLYRMPYPYEIFSIQNFCRILSQRNTFVMNKVNEVI